MVTTVTVNALYPSASLKAGEVLEYVGPGHNHLNVCVRRPGEKRLRYPARKWLDGLTEPEVSSPPTRKPEPQRCPVCGRETPEMEDK